METAAKEKELLLPQHCRLPSQPPLPQLSRPTQPVYYPDHGTPPHGTHTRLVTLQTPRRDGGNHRANLGGVGVTPGSHLHPSRWVGAWGGGCHTEDVPRRRFILTASPSSC